MHQCQKTGTWFCEYIKICGAAKFGGSFHGRGPMSIGLRKFAMRDRSVTLAISYNLPFAKVNQVHRNKKDVVKVRTG